MDRGFFITLQAIRRQLAAMPCDYYELRLIHGVSRKPFPGEQVWSVLQLTDSAMLRFLRLRNREGFDVFFRPFAAAGNAGYILVDLDRAEDHILDTMRSSGHEPCAVVRTSPGHLQAWLRVSPTPLESILATSVARFLPTSTTQTAPAPTVVISERPSRWTHRIRSVLFIEHEFRARGLSCPRMCLS